MATQLGNVAVGTTLYLEEDGSWIPYLVVQQGLPSSKYDESCNGTWLLRRDIYSNSIWANGSGPYTDDEYYLFSAMEDMLPLFSSEIQMLIKTATLPFCYQSTRTSYRTQTKEFKLFPLSSNEVNASLSNSYTDSSSEGSELSYFPYGSSTHTKRVANYNGSPAAWWLRSSDTESTNQSMIILENGQTDAYTRTVEGGVRPALILPTDLIVNDSNQIVGGIIPSTPPSISVPTSSVPSGSSFSVSWTAGSNATGYILQRSVNGGSWQTVYTGSSLTYRDTAKSTWTTVQYQVASTASGFTSAYKTSSTVNILPYNVTTLTVPSLIMQGQNFTVSWSSVSGATTYILQRNVNSGGWEQVYSGSSTSFEDTPESTWTTVQYQVQAGASGTYGAWKTSSSIPVISASALVISGTDEDLGTLTADVPYTVSTDTGNPITLTRTVNGNLVATLTVSSNFAYSIPVMDLPTGSGTIVINASVTASTGTVTATRTWTYTKTAITFPNSAGVAQLTMNGQNVLPPTVAEAVRVPTVWGGSLDKALELLLPVVNAAVVSVGTYVGTGTYGSDNPNTLTFTDDPQVVTIYGGGQTLVISSTDTSSPAYISGKTATWYSTTSAADQMNSDGVTYSYVAVAKGVTA